MRCPHCQTDVPLTSDACPACGSVLPVNDPGDLPVQTRLHHDLYVIERVIGHGGFSVTYLATHRDLKQRVAIKEFFPASLASRDPASGDLVPRRETRDLYRRALERVIREGQIMARFDHRGIVRVHNLFQERNTAYLVMELIEGHTLAEVLRRRGRLPEEDVRELMEQLVDALGALHDLGICHLDIKASNVMLTPAGRAVLLDFGAARQLIATSTGETSLRFGSPNYAPLEVINGEDTGPESDLFELGMLLHEILTGQRPPAAQQRAYRDTWTPDGLPEPWRRLCAGALQLDRTARPADVRAWWAGTGTPERRTHEAEQAIALMTAPAELPPTEMVSPRTAVETIVVAHPPSERPTDMMPEPGVEPSTEVMTRDALPPTKVLPSLSDSECTVRPRTVTAPAEAMAPSPVSQEVTAQAMLPTEVSYRPATTGDTPLPPPASPRRSADEEPAPAVHSPTGMSIEPEEPSPSAVPPLPVEYVHEAADLPDLPAMAHVPARIGNAVQRAGATAPVLIVTAPPADTRHPEGRHPLQREETIASRRANGNRLAGVLFVLLLAAVAFAVFSYFNNRRHGEQHARSPQTAPTGSPAASSPSASHSGGAGGATAGATPQSGATGAQTGTGGSTSGNPPPVNGNTETTPDDPPATNRKEEAPPQRRNETSSLVKDPKATTPTPIAIPVESSASGESIGGTGGVAKPARTNDTPNLPPAISSSPSSTPAVTPYMTESFRIDEQNGVVYARGIGTIPAIGKSEYLRIEHAKTAAVVQAQRFLSKALQGARIDEHGKTIIETVSGRVPPYDIVSKQKLDAHTYEVVIRAPLPR